MNFSELNAVEYFSPDKRWHSFGIKSRQKYLQWFVLEDRFHELAPEDVRKAYRTSQYLMAHAWYYWPMYDEAVKKMTHIFEIAIKQKAKQLGLELWFKNKKGEQRDKSLSQLIREIDKKEIHRQILDSLLKAKNFRNVLAHPTYDSWMGGIEASQNIIQYYINIINTLFLEYDLFDNYPQQFKYYNSFCTHINSDLYRITVGGKRYLIHRVLEWELYPSTSDYFFMAAFQMVTTNTYQSVSQGFVIDPIVIAIKVNESKPELISGTSLDNDETIIIEPTDQPGNQKLYKTYLADLDRLDQEDSKRLGKFMAGYKGGWAIERMKYQHLWGNYDFPEAGDS